MQRHSIDFTIGARRLIAVERALADWAFPLEALLTGTLPPPPEPGPDGLRVLSAPQARVADITARFAGFLAGGRQDYPRHYIDMTGSYEDYLARFSGKTRSTLRRKAKKLETDAGGIAITAHTSPGEIEAFLEAALPLSAKTYQARLLDAGLPADPAARRAMLEAAEMGQMRAFLLHAAGAPIAYLALPVAGDTLIYAHLGYDPEWARHSPGTVLQLAALEQLFAEKRFRYFDFTEGDGAHKAQFGSASIACTSLVLLRPTLANRALIAARGGFDGAVSGGKALAARSGALNRVRAVLRA